MTTRFSDTARGVLAATLLAGGTSIILRSSEGARFPILLQGDQFFVRLGNDQQFEIIRCGFRNGDAIACDTATQNWPVGTPVEVTISAAALEARLTEVGGTGPAGPAGPQGLSAYDVALSQGFVGSESQWLATLRGPVGPAGPAGARGVPGLSTEFSRMPPPSMPPPSMPPPAPGDEFKNRTLISFVQVVGDNKTSTFSIDHGLGTMNVLLRVRTNGKPCRQLHDSEYELLILDDDTLRVDFPGAPMKNEYVVLVLGLPA